MMNNTLVSQFKTIVLLCVALGLFAMPVAAEAFFTDTETSPQQQFQASELQLDTSLALANIALAAEQPSASTTLVVDTSMNSVSVAFDIAVADMSGALGFCDNIQFQAERGSVTIQSILGAFTTSEQTALGAYGLTFSLIDPDALVTGEECVVTMAVNAWQQNMSKTTGYQDTVEYELTITAVENAPALLQTAPLAGESIKVDEAAKSIEDTQTAEETDEQSSNGDPDAPEATVPAVEPPSDTSATPTASEAVVPADPESVQPTGDVEDSSEPKASDDSAAPAEESTDESKPNPSAKPEEIPVAEEEAEQPTDTETVEPDSDTNEEESEVSESPQDAAAPPVESEVEPQEPVDDVVPEPENKPEPAAPKEETFNE